MTTTTHVATHVEVRESDIAGRGLFAARAFAEGDLIERNEVIIVSVRGRRHAEKSELGGYLFEWEDGTAAVPMGRISFTNHSDEPNVRWLLDMEGEAVEMYAARDIAEDEELLADYTNGEGGDLWF